MRHSKAGVFVVALLLAGSTSALAQSLSVSPNSIIKARQAGMLLGNGNTDAMKPVVQSHGDVGVFKDAAKGLADWGR